MGIFEIIGPAMIGPSSSHTAGACRLGWVAGRLLAEPPLRAVFHLHGSFLATGRGHGTQEALIAGVLGVTPDDERIIEARDFAERSGLEYEFLPIDLGPQAHPNSARMILEGATRQVETAGSSVGGGSIRIFEIDGLACEMSGVLEALVFWHQDEPGFLARLTAVLSSVQVNLAGIRTSREQRGARAITVVEVDGAIPAEISGVFSRMPSIRRSVIVPPLPAS